MHASGKIFMGIGLVLFLIGGVMAAWGYATVEDAGESLEENEWALEGVTSGTIEIVDDDGEGELGFTIFIEGTYSDDNGNGVWDVGEDFTDTNGDGFWNGPELIKPLIERDGSHWLEPEMYEDPELFYDYRSIELRYQNAPGYFNAPINQSFIPGVPNPYYYMPNYAQGGIAWDEGRTFGGHDSFYADSRAITDEIRFDITSQITDSGCKTFRHLLTLSMSTGYDFSLVDLIYKI